MIFGESSFFSLYRRFWVKYFRHLIRILSKPKKGSENYRCEAINEVKKALKRVSGGPKDLGDSTCIRYSAEELIKIREKVGMIFKPLL